MAGFLKFLGICNAAIWFGSLVFFTIAAGPAFFSPEMVALLGKPHAGAAAQILLARYFQIQQVCALFALLHLTADWIYTGRPWNRYAVGLIAGILCAGMIGGYILQPKLKRLHLIMYAVQSTQSERDEAKQQFGLLHGASQVLNLGVLAGVLLYLWQVTRPDGYTRFVSGAKFRG